MSDPTPNKDRSQLSNAQLESLLSRPDLPAEERAGIEAELTKRIRDELLKTSQVRDAGQTARPPHVTPPPFNTGPGPSLPLKTKSNFPIVVGVIVALIIIGIIGFMGLMFLISNRGGRNGGSSQSSYSTRCVLNNGQSCEMISSEPVGSFCQCIDTNSGVSYPGRVR